MIGSLPKPIQNDFDAIVIDILSRYSLDNKSVQNFVQTVAQQTRAITRTPRLLKPAKKANSSNNEPNNETNNEQKSFSTRLENFKNTFNQGGLLGVFFEFLKNRKEAKTNRISTPDNKTKLFNTSTAITNNYNKEKDTKTNFYEKFISKLEKVQDTFERKGLVGVTLNLLNSFKKKTEAADTKQVPTSSYTTNTQNTFTPAAPAYNITNYTTQQAGSVNKKLLPQQQKNNNEQTPFTDTEGLQSQKQNVFREFTVTLGGINDEGKKDLIEVIKSVFEDIEATNFRRTAATPPPSKTTEEEEEEDSTSVLEMLLGGLDVLADAALARSLFGGGKRKKSLGGGKKGSKARQKARSQGKGYQGPKNKPTTAKPSPAAPKVKPGRFIPKPSAGGLVRGAATGVATLGLGMLADWGGQMVGGEIAKGIYGEEKTAAAYEEYGADIFGLFRASWDATKAIGEAKEARERLEKLNKQTIPLDIKAMMFGYKDLKEFGEAVVSGKEKRRMYWDEQKQSVVVINPDKSQEIHKFIYGKGFPNKPEIIDEDGKKSDKKQLPPVTINPDIKQVPPNTPKAPNIETPSIKPEFPIPLDIKSVQSSDQIAKTDTSITPDTTTITSPVPPSVTENTITNNNNIDKKTLSNIADNTKQTNKNLASLGDAIFRLANKIGDNKQSNQTIVVNGNNGQSQEYTSAAETANSNIDVIRAVRRRYLAAIG